MWDVIGYFDNMNNCSFFLQSSVLLTCLQKDVIVGTLLGDSSLERDKPTHNPRIRFDQSYPQHKSYLESLYVLFANGTPYILVNLTNELVKFIRLLLLNHYVIHLLITIMIYFIFMIITGNDERLCHC